MWILLKTECLYICIFLGLCQSRVAFFEPLARKNTSSFISTINASGFRKVHVVTDFYLYRKAVSQQSGLLVYGGHAQISIDGTDKDGPLAIELGINPRHGNSKTHLSKALYAVRCIDHGIENTGKSITPTLYPKTIRHEATTGETLLTNADLFDPKTGKGLVADAWMEDPVYRMGLGSTPNTCYDLLVRVLRRMNLEFDTLTKKMFDNSTEYYTEYSRKMSQRVQHVASLATQPRSEGMISVGVFSPDIKIVVWNVDFEQNPDAPILVSDSDINSSGGSGLFPAEDQSEMAMSRNISIF